MTRRRRCQICHELITPAGVQRVTKDGFVSAAEQTHHMQDIALTKAAPSVNRRRRSQTPLHPHAPIRR